MQDKAVIWPAKSIEQYKEEALQRRPAQLQATGYSSCRAAMEGEQAARPSKFRRICVFCGSSQGKKRSYQDSAVELAKELVMFSVSPPNPSIHDPSTKLLLGIDRCFRYPGTLIWCTEVEV